MLYITVKLVIFLYCLSVRITWIYSAVHEQFEDTKGVIRIRKSKKDKQHNGQKKKGQTTIYKTLHIKLKIE